MNLFLASLFGDEEWQLKDVLFGSLYESFDFGYDPNSELQKLKYLHNLSLCSLIYLTYKNINLVQSVF